MRCISLSLLLRFYVQYPVMLRDTAGGEGLKVVFLCLKPLALLGIFLYIVTEILEEKGVILLLL